MEEGGDKTIVTKWYETFPSFGQVLIYLKYLAICVKILKYG